MSPRPLDPDAIRRRLHELDQRLRWLADLGNPSGAELRESWRTRLAVERILEQLVELAVGTNMHIAGALGISAGDSYRGSFQAVADAGVITPELAAELAPSAGLRNILVHDYLDIDLDVVADAIPDAAEQFDRYRRQVGRWLASREGEG